MPCIAMYCHVSPCITMLSHVMPCIAIYSHVLPCIAMYSHVMPCIAMYSHVLPHIAMYSHVMPRGKIDVFETPTSAEKKKIYVHVMSKIIANLVYGLALHEFSVVQSG